MKQLLLLMVIGCVINLSAHAQKLSESKVPAVVTSAFSKKYPGKTAKWEKENGQFEAGFRDNGQSMSVLFAADGTMTESEIAIPVKSLPTSVLSYIKLHYKGATITEGAKITKANGTVNYEAEVNKKDVLFDEKGNYLKEVKD